MHARMHNFKYVEPQLKYPRLASVCTHRVLGLEIRPDYFLCSWTNLELPGFSKHTSVVREFGLFIVHPLDLYHFLWYVRFLLECILVHNTNLIGFVQLHKKAGLQGSSFLFFCLCSLFHHWLDPGCYACEVNLSKRLIIEHLPTVKQLIPYTQREFEGNVGLVYL